MLKNRALPYLIALVYIIIILSLLNVSKKNGICEMENEDTNSYAGISVKKWYQARKSAYSMTFDDGSVSHYKHLHPLLDKYGFKATFYLITSSLGEESPGHWRFGSWKGFIKLAEYGHEIGSHSVTHPHMKKLTKGDTNTRETLEYEAYQSKKAIEEKITNQKCLTFAFPFCERNPAIDKVMLKYYEAGRACAGQAANSSLKNIQWMSFN